MPTVLMDVKEGFFILDIEGADDDFFMNNGKLLSSSYIQEIHTNVQTL